MRTARPVGLTDDGRSLIVETDDGEQLAILADTELRRVLRGDRPRRPVEIEVESRLTPREIQMKVRAGASAEEIADASGMPIDRVEAFAAPVIAERNHIAGLAQQGSVRRRGEPAGHRTLRAAVSERLRERGVDPAGVRWDAFKMEDGRWSVSADYRLEQADREAIFYFDQRGRFSVAGNDEARWAIGEDSDSGVTASADPIISAGPIGIADADTEPTLKLAGPAEEMALLRALETGAENADPEPTAPEPADDVTEPAFPAEAHSGAGTDEELLAELEADEPVSAEPSQMDLLYDLLGSEGYAEDSIRVYDGLTDAAAVPDVADGSWQPAAEEQSYPAEPAVDDEPELAPQSESEPATEPAPEPSAPVEPTAADKSAADLAAADLAAVEPAGTEPQVLADGATQEPLPGADPAAGAEPGQGGPAGQPDGPARSKKRKRAAVPSWDEIMFGSPKSK